MRSLHIAVFVSIVALGATPAGAQFGLYGSPEMLNLSQPDPAAVPYGGYATPASYPARPLAPVARSVPAVPVWRYTRASVQPAVGGQYVTDRRPGAEFLRGGPDAQRGRQPGGRRLLRSGR